MPRQSYFLRFCLLLSLLWWVGPLAGQGLEPGSESGSIYIPMEPPFVTNYGGKGRLKYLKAEVSLRVDKVQTATAVRHHMPLLRNAMVMLFSRQQDATVSTQEGVELLREAAREELNALLASESAPPGITEVYFSSLVVQK